MTVAKTQEHERAHQGLSEVLGNTQLHDFEKAAELAKHIQRYHRRSAIGKASLHRLVAAHDDYHGEKD